jgi:hypothetical protein
MTFGSSVVSFSGGLAAISHGLGVKPSVVIVTNGDYNVIDAAMAVLEGAANSSTFAVKTVGSTSSGVRRVNWIAIP